MEYNHKISFVEGNLNDSGEMVTVVKEKYNEVNLGLRAEGQHWIIPIATVKLYSQDLARHAKEVFPAAYDLANEIADRWNANVPDLKKLNNMSIANNVKLYLKAVNDAKEIKNTINQQATTQWQKAYGLDVTTTFEYKGDKCKFVGFGFPDQKPDQPIRLIYRKYKKSGEIHKNFMSMYRSSFKYVLPIKKDKE